MSQNIVEYLRQESVKRLFLVKGVNKCWPTWITEINAFTSGRTPKQIFDLGDHLSEIFKTTATAGRSQSSVSGGGANWEALVCWYLNLCLIGCNTVVIKHHKSLIPSPISDAITVNYNNFVSNTESDLIAISFPNKIDYSIDKDAIAVNDTNGIPVIVKSRKKYNLLGILNALAHRDLSDIGIHVVQCKTNWNDNAQIPMLWDMIYSAKSFTRGIVVGKNAYSIHSANRFSYSFVTVPTSRIDNINHSSTCVQRVNNLSGGNYWGKKTQNGVALSIKEIFSRNFDDTAPNILASLKTELPKLTTDYKYLNL